MSAIHRPLILILLSLGLLAPASAVASQSGGSIYYEDPAALGQDLEFRASVWHVPDDYYRAVVAYRQVGTGHWKGLDKSWCWTRRCALEEMVSQARFIARDGYIWRFQVPTPPPARATGYRFTEASYSDGPRPCAARLVKRS